jgi:hypothetical protein
MHARKRPILAVLLALSLAALSCAFPASPTPPPVGDLPTITPPTELPPAVPTTAAPPTEVPATATASPTATVTPTSIPCDRAAFVSDVTVPDGTDYAPGATLTKTWRLRNNGSCTWTSGYALVFDHGDSMGAPATQQLTTGTVAPGQTIDISVTLTAPASEGTYRGYFKLRNPSGVVFGIGANADVAFWVEIEVMPAGFTFAFDPDWLVPMIPLIPTADFSLAVANVHTCGTNRVVTFRLGNDDDVTFESFRLSMTDSTAGVAYMPVTVDAFATSSSTCSMSEPAFPPGGNRYIIRVLSPGSVAGNSFSATVRACSENGLSGTCVDHTLTFNLP